jgi:hypothetical protein
VQVFIDGQHVVRDGKLAAEDVIVADAAAAGRRVAERAGFPLRTGWPFSE